MSVNVYVGIYKEKPIWMDKMNKFGHVKREKPQKFLGSKN